MTPDGRLRVNATTVPYDPGRDPLGQPLPAITPVVTAPVKPVAGPAVPTPEQAREREAVDVLTKVAKADPNDKPVETAYNRVYDADPDDGATDERIFLRRHGFDPDDKAQQPQVNRFLQVHRELRTLGYSDDQLSKLLDDRAGTKSLVDEFTNRYLETYDDKVTQARDMLLQQQANRRQQQSDVLRSDQARALQAQMDNEIAAARARAGAEINAANEVERANRAAQYFNPVSGKVEYVPGYQPRQARAAADARADFETGVERIRAKYANQFERLSAAAITDAGKSAEASDRLALSAFDAQAKRDRLNRRDAAGAAVRQYLAVRKDDLTPDGGDGEPLPFIKDAEKKELDARTEKAKRSGGALSAVGDVGVDILAGATGAVLGIGYLGSLATDKIGLTSTAADSVAGYSDAVDKFAKRLHSDAYNLQADDVAKEVNKATEGKQGVEAFASGAYAGLTMFGMDRHTFGTVGRMIGAVGLGFGTGAAAGAAGATAKVAGTAARTVGVGAVAGQAADDNGRQAAESTRQLMSDPAIRSASPMFRDLKARFEGRTDEQIVDMMAESSRAGAAVAGAAVAGLSTFLGAGVEAQLLRTGVVRASTAAAASTGALATTSRVVGRAVGEGLQEATEDLASNVAGALGRGQSAAEGVEPGKLGASFGAGAALGGVVGNAHAALARIRGGKPAADEPPAPTAPPTTDPLAPTAPPTTDPLAPPAPAGTELLALPPPSLVTPPPTPEQTAVALVEAHYQSAPDVKALPAPSSEGYSDVIASVADTLRKTNRALDQYAGGEVAALVGEYTKSYDFTVPTGSVVQFNSPGAHHGWVANALDTGNDTPFFSTPEGPNAFALVQHMASDADVPTIVRIEQDGTRTKVDGSVDTPAMREAAAVINGLNRLGSEIRLGVDAEHNIDGLLLQAAQDTERAATEGVVRAGNSIAPPLLAQTSVQSAARAVAIFDESRSDKVKTGLTRALQRLFPEQDMSAVNPGAHLLNNPNDIPGFVQALERKGTPRAVREAGAELVQNVRDASSDARVAEINAASRVTRYGAPLDVTPDATREIVSIAAQPVRDVALEALDRAINSVPSVGPFAPGGHAAADTTVETDAAREAYASFQLAVVLEDRPGITVAQARNLAVHFGAGRVDPAVIVRQARQLADARVDTAEAARVEGLKLTKAQLDWDRTHPLGIGYPSLGPVVATPISSDALASVVEKFVTDQGELNPTVWIIETDGDPRAGGNRGFKGLVAPTPEGKRVILLNRQRIADADDARAVLDHELVTHFAPIEILGREKFARVLEAAISFAKKDRATDTFRRQFELDYRRATGRAPSRHVVAAEIFSYLLDQQRTNAPALVKRISDALAGGKVAPGAFTKDSLPGLLRAIINVTEGRTTVEAARTDTEWHNELVDPDVRTRGQGLHPRVDSAYAASTVWWDVFRNKFDDRRNTTRIPTLFTSLIESTRGSIDAASAKLAAEFRAAVDTVVGRTSALYNRSYEPHWRAVELAVSRRAREAGVSPESMQAKLDEFLLATHAITRNTWKTRLDAPLVKADRFRRQHALKQWRNGEIGKAELAATLDAITTDEHLLAGAKDRAESKGEAFVERDAVYKRRDQLYAGRDMTIAKAEVVLAWLSQDAQLMALYADTKPHVQAIRERILSQRKAAGYDPNNYATLFSDDYVPIRPSGDSGGTGSFRAAVSEFGQRGALARTEGLGDHDASRGQLAELKSISRLAADEGVNQNISLMMMDMLTQIGRMDPDMVKVLDRQETLTTGSGALLATIKPIGTFSPEDGTIQKSGLDGSLVVRDAAGQFGERGMFYEIYFNDKATRDELKLQAGDVEVGAFTTGARFITRTAQGALIQYNPAGIARNVLRDSQTALSVGFKYGVTGRVASTMGKLIGGLNGSEPNSTARAFREYFYGGNEAREAFMNKEFKENSVLWRFQQFAANGGVQEFSAHNRLAGEAGGSREAIEAAATRLAVADNKAAQNAVAWLDKWRHSAEYVENINRFALAEALMNGGKHTPQEATRVATNMVLNYNHSSQVGRWLAPFVFFANPSIADLHANLTQRIWKDGVAPVVYEKQADGRTKEVFRPDWYKSIDVKYVGLRVGLMLAQTVLLVSLMAPDDWKRMKLEEVVNNYLIPDFGALGGMARVSKPYGIDRILDAAIIAPLLMYFGHQKPGDLARDMFNVVSKNLSPGVDIQLRQDTSWIYDLVRTVVPSIVQPVADVAGAGVNRFGQNIRPGDFYRNAPAYTATRPSTEDVWYDIARASYRSAGIDVSGDQIKAFTTEYAAFVPFASVLSQAAATFGRQSAQAELNEASGRAALGPVTRFMNSIGSPVSVREQDNSPEAEHARWQREHVQPFKVAVADAQRRDVETMQRSKGQQTSDRLDLNKMGTNERALWQDNPNMLALAKLDKEYAQREKAARNAVDDARARGLGEARLQAAVSLRRILEEKNAKARSILDH
jgi:hypothetical protein